MKGGYFNIFINKKIKNDFFYFNQKVGMGVALKI